MLGVGDANAIPGGLLEYLPCRILETICQLPNLIH